MKHNFTPPRTPLVGDQDMLTVGKGASIDKEVKLFPALHTLSRWEIEMVGDGRSRRSDAVNPMP